MTRFLSISLVLLASCSAVFAQTYTVVRNFQCANQGTGGPAEPSWSGIIAQSRGGAMLTTTPYCLSSPAQAFRISPNGSLNMVLNFGVTNPVGGLTLATDGLFYGTTDAGGPNAKGTVFKMTQSGSVTNLYKFTNGSDGALPTAPPIQSLQGDLYGTTHGANTGSDYGSIYRITEGGNFTVLHSFTHSDGAYPTGPLVQGANYYFYGTTQEGGTNNNGTIFRISSSGNFQVLVNFTAKNGAIPYDGLIQASDGNFYGVTYYGGSTVGASPGDGVLFRVTPTGAYTVLHNFTNGSDGGHPVGGLVQASDGNLYGTTTSGGKNGYGVLFRATLAGNVVPLHDFASASGTMAIDTLLQHTNGKLYGMTTYGGTSNQGVFYSLDAHLPPFVTYLPVYGRPGAEVEILGQGFTSSSKVYFNGTQATNVMDVCPTYIRAEVPQAATTGPITVTTKSGTLKSNKVFIVH
jgi:uncharacterized repeat protein (TIGR03803 family)